MRYCRQEQWQVNIKRKVWRSGVSAPGAHLRGLLGRGIVDWEDGGLAGGLYWGSHVGRGLGTGAGAHSGSSAPGIDGSMHGGSRAEQQERFTIPAEGGQAPVEK